MMAPTWAPPPCHGRGWRWDGAGSVMPPSPPITSPAIILGAYDPCHHDHPSNHDRHRPVDLPPSLHTRLMAMPQFWALFRPWSMAVMHVPPGAWLAARRQQVSVQVWRPAPISTHCRTSPAAIYPMAAAYPFLSMPLFHQKMFRPLGQEVSLSSLDLA
jgi:hypothetical protein